MKEEIDQPTVTGEDLSTPLSTVDRPASEKANKEIEDMKNIAHGVNLRDTSGIFYSRRGHNSLSILINIKYLHIKYSQD